MGRWIAVSKAVSHTVQLRPSSNGNPLTSQQSRLAASLASVLVNPDQESPHLECWREQSAGGLVVTWCGHD